MLLSDKKQTCIKNEVLGKQQTRNMTATHQDSESKRDKINGKCTVDKDSVVDVSLINVTVVSDVHKVTLLGRIQLM